MDYYRNGIHNEVLKMFFINCRQKFDHQRVKHTCCKNHQCIQLHKRNPILWSTMSFECEGRSSGSIFGQVNALHGNWPMAYSSVSTCLQPTYVKYVWCVA